MKDRSQPMPAVLQRGWLDGVLAAILAALSLVSWTPDTGWVVALDLAACCAAALVPRWPRFAGVVLGALLMGYFATPSQAAEFGQYAPMIPILGTGLRGQRGLRLWMSIGYGLTLASLLYQDNPSGTALLLGPLVWASLIAVLWLIGNAFMAYRTSQDRLGRLRSLKSESR